MIVEMKIYNEQQKVQNLNYQTNLHIGRFLETFSLGGRIILNVRRNFKHYNEMHLTEDMTRTKLLVLSIAQMRLL